MKKIGDRLDLSFEVTIVSDGQKEKRPLVEMINGPTWISVYMRNNTNSCDRQLIQLNESYQELRLKGFRVLGLSKDTPGSHLKFAIKHAIPFPLISDPNHQFAEAVDSLIEKKMYGRAFLGPSRSSFLLDEAGTILSICEKVDPANHGRQLLELGENLK